ncbi:MAG: SCP2 sterol-binding domain-containing protein [Armatimonadota bacterium]|nr:MAG: SCP2 sterol-binding domain-containing protein [Armatimonadota bacterium]
MAAVDSFFAALPERFNAEAAAGVEAVFHFNITGEGGGQYAVTVANGECKVEQGAPDKADVTVTLAASDMAAIVAGDQDPTAAFMAGRLQVDGDILLAMKIGDLFLSG